MKWNRPSGKPIDLKDTPEMTKFAINNGWTKKKPVAKKTLKKDSE